jgi:hypothetical protein
VRSRSQPSTQTPLNSATGVCALAGIGGAGKTAIAERLLRVLPGGLPALPHTPKDDTLPTPRALFVFSFYDAPNPDSFFAELSAWLTDFYELRSSRREAHAEKSEIRNPRSEIEIEQSLVTSAATSFRDSRSASFGAFCGKFTAPAQFPTPTR